MANVLVNDTSLTAIGNAIREKNGETTLYKPAEMATAIQALATGGGGGELKVVSMNIKKDIRGSRYVSSWTIDVSNDNFPANAKSISIQWWIRTLNSGWQWYIGVYDATNNTITTDKTYHDYYDGRYERIPGTTTYNKDTKTFTITLTKDALPNNNENNSRLYMRLVWCE